MNEGKIGNSHATGSVVGDEDTGGLVGENKGGIINNSYAIGNVSGRTYIAGLVGWNTDGGTISNSYAAGSVSASESDVGGLVGINSNNGIVSNSYAIGSISGNNRVGGLIGAHVSGTVNNSFWDVQTTEQVSSAGATGLTTTQMQDSTGSILNLANGMGTDENGAPSWIFTPNTAYPKLRKRNADGDFGNLLPPSILSQRVIDTAVNDVGISWSVVQEADSFMIYREEMLIAITSDFAYTDRGLQRDTVYRYQIKPCNNGSCYALSEILTVLTISAPMDLQAEAAATNVDLSWDTVVDATYYQVYRDDVLVATTDAVEFTDNNLEIGVGYNYQVKACNDRGCSVLSDTLAIATYSSAFFSVSTKYGDAGILISCLATSDISDSCKIMDEDTGIEWNLIYNIEQMQAIDDNLSKNYLLMKNIDASATASWNGGAGFDPIGDISDRFAGIFDGGNNVITNLFINRAGVLIYGAIWW